MATVDPYVEVLRGLSLGKRHGVLSVQEPDTGIDVVFQEGRVVAARNSHESPALRVIRRLVDSGQLDMDAGRKILPRCTSADKLFTELVQGGLVTADIFLRAKRASELDILYNLRRYQSPELRFISKVTKQDQKFSFALSPGQLLLDLVELETEEPNYERLKRATASSVKAQVLHQGEIRLTASEREVMAHCRPGVELESVVRAVLLSEFEVCRALQALITLDILVTSLPGEDDDEEDDDDPAWAALAAAEAVAVVETDERFDISPLDEFQIADEEDLGVEPAAAEKLVLPHIAAPLRFEGQPEPAPALTSGSWAIGGEEFNSEYEQWAGPLATLFFLMAVALVVPELVSHWFVALGDFSSQF